MVSVMLYPCIVFYSSAFINLNKGVFVGHLCQTVNNFVK